jgi:hypothetical protein
MGAAMLKSGFIHCLGTVTLVVLVTPALQPVCVEETAKQAYDQALPRESLLWSMHQSEGLGVRSRCFHARFLLPQWRLPSPRPRGLIKVMRDAGTYYRVDVVLHIHRHEIELLSPTTARGFAAADYTFYYPPGQSFPTTGHEAYGIVPEETLYSPTSYYQTYEKVDGKWKIKTSDHNSFDLKRDFRPYTIVMPNAHVTPDRVPPYKR